MTPPLRPLADTGLSVTPIALGCWPIAGITSVGTSPDASRATVQAAFEAGINHFDTAHAYGYDGESERIVGDVLRPHRDKVVIATKCGLVWDAPEAGSTGKRPQRRDGRPSTIRKQCHESLERLGTDHIDLYYLHAPDPEVPLTESAGELRRLLDDGLIRAVGVSNFREEAEYAQFAAECPIAADQQPYNMLQREIESDRIPWGQSYGQPNLLLTVYWPLMKGLLAGKITRDHQFAENDSRPGYAVFQGREWEKTHDFLDRLRPLAEGLNATVAQLVIAWTMSRPGIGSVLCGAKGPDQIIETAAAMTLEIPSTVLAEIDAALTERGPVG